MTPDVEPTLTRSARSTTVARFVLRTLGYLPLTFFVWYFAAPVLLYPAVLLVRAIAKLTLHDIVRSVEQARAMLTFITALRPSGAAAGSVLTADVNLLIYAYGLPLFAALTLAAGERAWKRHLVIGYAALLPCVALPAIADFLKSVAITAGPAVASQTGFVAWQREAIAFAFQFGSLIVPAVAPAVLWVALHGRFLADLRHRGAASP
ncbi:MAG TPA: exosortase H-associated membrane protein [Casimicrobiaceae bacterium]|nr:exosortase H-associated membrane protein [Casimicrobiaceae bacterium]